MPKDPVTLGPEKHEFLLQKRPMFSGHAERNIWIQRCAHTETQIFSIRGTREGKGKLETRISLRPPSPPDRDIDSDVYVLVATDRDIDSDVYVLVATPTVT